MREKNTLELEFFILSSNQFNKKYEELVSKTIDKYSKKSTWAWFHGLDSVKDLHTFNSLIEDTNIVIMFFDKDLLKIKELESLFDLLTLREVDRKLKIIPIAIGPEPHNIPKFLISRLIYVGDSLTE